MYAYTDQEGWPVYQYFYQNGQGITLWLHFYDEGLFYDGFYVINTSEVWGKRMDTKTKYFFIHQIFFAVWLRGGGRKCVHLQL